MIDAGIGANSASGGYDIDNSLKFESDNSEYMSRTPSSAGNRKTWTLSCWVKRTELDTSVSRMILSAGDTYLHFVSDQLWANFRTAGTNYFLGTNRLFRDTAAWYHIVLQCDTTQATASNRAKLYINGVQETSFTNTTYDGMALNYDTGMNNAVEHEVGKYTLDETTYAELFNGYMAEMHLVDGTALTPTSFGEFDEDSGIWKPKAYTGSYGTNGFFLDFSDAANLGDDASGNGNNFTETNITSADQATDTPTNNFCTWLSDGTLFNTGSDNMLFNEGGTRMTRGGGTGWTTHYANMAPSSGKWYFEHESAGLNNTMMGAIPVEGTTDNSSGRNNHYLGNVAGHGVGYHFIDRYVYQNGSGFLNGGSNPNSGTIVQVALDLDNGKVYFGLDNVWLNGSGSSSNPSTGSNGLSLAGWSSEQMWMFAGSSYNPNVNQSTNFGGYTEMSISSAASDANGYGTFEYAPPTGFYALCTKNLAEYG